jgi:hypothetical protein
MGVNSINNSAQTYSNKTNKNNSNNKKQTVTDQKSTNADTAAVYSKNNNETEPKKVFKKDSVTIDRLLKEAEKRSESLRKLVEKMLLKQGQTFTETTDIYALLREGKLEVDSKISIQAQNDISEEGYWGVNQTSDRLVSFAKALTGGDPSKAEEMIAAVKQGFEEATKAWGGELPEICKNTLNASIRKLEAWRDSESMERTAAEEFKNQASKGNRMK